MLCRFLWWKALATVLLYSLYFAVGPWAGAVCRWMCETNYNGVQALGTGEECERRVAVLQACRGGVYAVYALVTLRAAYHFAACHPGNDGTSGAEAEDQEMSSTTKSQ